MDEVKVSGHAKVNLGLDVLEKRPSDGYHYVRSVMLPITLADEITVKKQAEKITVTTEPDVAGPMETNLAYRAAVLLKQVTGYTGGADIRVQKHIPVAGGLAGGSSNAAAALTALNQLWETSLTHRQLIDLGIQLGSDVPFFITEVPARVEGIGERLTPIPVHTPIWFVLAMPPVAKSTANVYKLFDQLSHVHRPDIAALESALAEGNLVEVAASLGNVFEEVMLPLHPAIADLKATMLAGGALGALMSGAGPTVFGIVEDEAAGMKLMNRLSGASTRVFLAQSIGGT